MFYLFRLTIIRFPLSAFLNPGNRLSFCKISQEIKGYKVQIKMMPSFQSRSLFLLHQTSTCYKYNSRFWNFSGNGKKKIFAMISPLRFAFETTKFSSGAMSQINNKQRIVSQEFIPFTQTNDIIFFMITKCVPCFNGTLLTKVVHKIAASIFFLKIEQQLWEYWFHPIHLP